MSGQWHYSQNGAQYGPVDEAEIIRLIQEGELAPGTPVLKVGSMDWQPAREHACFQVEIYPKRKAIAKPLPAGTSLSASQTAAQPAEKPSSSVVTTVIVKEKSVLPWMLFGGTLAALAAVMVWVLFFMDREGDVPPPQRFVTLVTNRPPVAPPATNSLPVPQPDTSGGEISIVADDDNIVINPAGSNGTRYLLVEIYLTRGNDSDKDFRPAIKTNTKMLKKITMDKLSTLNVQQCTDPSIRPRIMYQLKAAYQEVLGSKHPIKDLILATWVMQ